MATRELLRGAHLADDAERPALAARWHAVGVVGVECIRAGELRQAALAHAKRHSRAVGVRREQGHEVLGEGHAQVGRQKSVRPDVPAQPVPALAPEVLAIVDQEIRHAPEELVRELYEAENKGKAQPSGSQDMIGLIYPGVNRLDYDYAANGGVFPAHIESCNSPKVARWLEKVLHLLLKELTVQQTRVSFHQRLLRMVNLL